MSDTVRVDTAAFESALGRFIALKRISLADGIPLQGGLLADELVRDTPPQAGKVGSRQYGARKAGEARAARDIARAVRPLNPRDWKSRGLADLIRAKKYDQLQVVFERFSSLKIVPFTEDLHRKAQDVDGRVRRQGVQATPDHLEHAAYVKRIKERVGLAKGGWVASQRGLGRKPQSWLLKHAWVGAFEDHTGEAEPHVRLLNNSDWAGGRLAGIIVNKALTRREGRMTRWIEGALAANARRAGLA